MQSTQNTSESRSLTLRDALMLAVVTLITAAFAVQIATAGSLVRAPSLSPTTDRMPRAEQVQTLPLTPLTETTIVPADATTLVPRSAMPIERGLTALDDIQQGLRSENASLQRRAVHRVSVLSLQEKNAPYLQALRPSLKDVAFGYDTPTNVRLEALPALLRIAPEQTLYAIEARVETESSARVQRAMIQMLQAKWTPEMGVLHVDA